ncbi:hypothetical protein [Paenibacillus elgii]|uniref:hypothetical protein n=1 Tax=Paenibacillus elgii TaxID=189691 RepID=UPI000A5D9A6B|nr:hypothetical protein [Paenibacillus elgii]
MESVNRDGDDRIIAAREGGERYARSMLKGRYMYGRTTSRKAESLISFPERGNLPLN